MLSYWRKSGFHLISLIHTQNLGTSSRHLNILNFHLSHSHPSLTHIHSYISNMYHTILLLYHIWKYSQRGAELMLGGSGGRSPQVNYRHLTARNSIFCTCLVRLQLKARSHMINDDHHSSPSPSHHSSSLTWGGWVALTTRPLLKAQEAKYIRFSTFFPNEIYLEGSYTAS